MGIASLVVMQGLSAAPFEPQSSSTMSIYRLLFWYTLHICVYFVGPNACRDLFSSFLSSLPQSPNSMRLTCNRVAVTETLLSYRFETLHFLALSSPLVTMPPILLLYQQPHGEAPSQQTPSPSCSFKHKFLCIFVRGLVFFVTPLPPSPGFSFALLAFF